MAQRGSASEWSVAVLKRGERRGRPQMVRHTQGDVIKPGLSVEDLAKVATLGIPVTPSVVGRVVEDTAHRPDQVFAAARVAAAMVSWCGPEVVDAGTFATLHDSARSNDWGSRGPRHSMTPNAAIVMGNRAMQTLATAFGYRTLWDAGLPYAEKVHAVERWDAIAAEYGHEAQRFDTRGVFTDVVLTDPLARHLSNDPALFRLLSGLKIKPTLHVPTREDGKTLPPPNDAWDIPFDYPGSITNGRSFCADMDVYEVEVHDIPAGSDRLWTLAASIEPRGITIAAEMENSNLISVVPTRTVGTEGVSRRLSAVNAASA